MLRGRHGSGGHAAVLRRAFLIVVLLLLSVAVAVKVVWERMAPLSFARAEALSVTVLDRDDQLLRAYTASDGRWRLPVDANEVDARYVAMLLAFEDARFRSH
ncbi:MAG TPA: penicillin-binding protein 1C, partial [Hyphomicrobiaceae bacterium]|nr:penicillin-binding protein 1C [Hyphomicrobiaceae bacterium]